MNAVNRIFNILEVLVREEEALSAGELSHLSKVSIATTYRICAALANKGYLKKQAGEGKYSLGIKFLQFNAAIQRSLNIANISLPHLEKLSRLSGEHSSVGVLDNYEAVVVAQVDVPNSLRISNQIGERLPLNATAIGKVLLAYMNKNERESFFKNAKLRRFTGSALTSVERLEEEIEKIWQSGYAINDEEYTKGVWSVAAPIFGMNKDIVAALALVIPSVRVHSETQAEFISFVKDAASDISKEIGGVNP